MTETKAEPLIPTLEAFVKPSRANCVPCQCLFRLFLLLSS